MNKLTRKDLVIHLSGAAAGATKESGTGPGISTAPVFVMKSLRSLLTLYCLSIACLQRDQSLRTHEFSQRCKGGCEIKLKLYTPQAIEANLSSEHSLLRWLCKALVVSASRPKRMMKCTQ